MRSLVADLAPRSLALPAIMLGCLVHSVEPRHSQQQPEVPIYVRMQAGWLGLFGHSNAYARFPLIGPAIQLQAADRVLLAPNLGVSVSFVTSADLGGADLLSAHVRWETSYWRQQAAQLAATSRPDLTGNRRDVRVTQLTLLNADGDTLVLYLVGLRAPQGVYAFGFSPGGPGVDSIVRSFARSLTLVNRSLSPAEVRAISDSLKGRTRAPERGAHPTRPR